MPLSVNRVLSDLRSATCYGADLFGVNARAHLEALSEAGQAALDLFDDCRWAFRFDVARGLQWLADRVMPQIDVELICPFTGMRFTNNDLLVSRLNCDVTDESERFLSGGAPASLPAPSEPAAQSSAEGAPSDSDGAGETSGALTVPDAPDANVTVEDEGTPLEGRAKLKAAFMAGYACGAPLTEDEWKEVGDQWERDNPVIDLPPVPGDEDIEGVVLLPKEAPRGRFAAGDLVNTPNGPGQVSYAHADGSVTVEFEDDDGYYRPEQVAPLPEPPQDEEVEAGVMPEVKYAVTLTWEKLKDGYKSGGGRFRIERAGKRFVLKEGGKVVRKGTTLAQCKASANFIVNQN